MTYCLGMLLDAGLIMMADTRTNAGVDNFSTFKKMHALAEGDDRRVFAATAGSLSVSQSVISMLLEDHLAAETGEISRSLKECTTMFRAAQLVGEAVERANDTVGTSLEKAHIDSAVELLVGGRIGQGPLRLFLVYSAGNFIECTSEVPFLQVGETKYGRPILDRGLHYETPLDEAVKIGLLSFDSTMKSNLGVARPIDIMVMPRELREPILHRRIDVDDAYFDAITVRWMELLLEATQAIPNPSWMAKQRADRQVTSETDSEPRSQARSERQKAEVAS
jgi:putative proteasome-type protease